MNNQITSAVIPFSYIVSSGSLANAANSQVTLNLAADSSFELHAILATSSADDPADFRPNNFSCQITDQATGRQLSNSRIPQVLMAGDMFTVLREGRLVVWPPLATLQFDFLNTSGETASAQIVFKGYKLLGATK